MNLRMHHFNTLILESIPGRLIVPLHHLSYRAPSTGHLAKLG